MGGSARDRLKVQIDILEDSKPSFKPKSGGI